MKKILLSLILSLTIIAANAQDASISHMSWPATAVLPEKGDWSLGFDVIPVISAAGNLFHSPAGNDSIFSQQQYTLVGLYVKNDNTAYRFNVRIGFGSQKMNNIVVDNTNTATQLTDTWTATNTNITIGAGIQKNKGKGRLRLIYGGEASIMISASGNSFSYGNPMTSAGANSTNFNEPLGDGFYNDSLNALSRITTANSGTTFGLGLNAFVGVEYFFAPKMSLSAEYGWGFMYTSTGEGTVTVESWTGGGGGSDVSTSVPTPSSSAFSLDVTNATSIILHFYL